MICLLLAHGVGTQRETGAGVMRAEDGEAREEPTAGVRKLPLTRGPTDPHSARP